MSHAFPRSDGGGGGSGDAPLQSWVASVKTSSSSSSSGQSREELEDEVRRAREERARRRSRLSGAGVRGIDDVAAKSYLAGVDDAAPLSPSKERENTFAKLTSNVSSPDATSSPNARGAALLSRYGGASGPTGTAAARADAPTSLANFMGGRATGPRLGKLAGDGRGAPPEAAGLTRDEAPRALPGMVGPQGGMAGMLEARKRQMNSAGGALSSSPTRSSTASTSPSRAAARLPQPPASPARQSSFDKRLASPERKAVFGNSGSTAGHQPKPRGSPERSIFTAPLPAAAKQPSPERKATQELAPRPTSPVRQSSFERRPASPVRTSSLVGSTAARLPSPERKRSFIEPVAAAPAPRSASPVRSTPAAPPASPVRATPTPVAVATPTTLPAPQRFAAPTASRSTSAASINSMPRSPAFGSASPITKASPAFASTHAPASADKPPSASITRLRGRSMVQQRLREAEERRTQTVPEASVLEAPTVGLPRSPAKFGGGKWGATSPAVVQAELPTPPKSAPAVVAAEPQRRKWQVADAPSLDSPASASGVKANKPWTPGRHAQLLPGMGVARSNSAEETNTRSSSPVRSRSPARSKTAPQAEEQAAPVRLPGMGGEKSPFAARELTQDKEANKELTSVTAGRAKGPQKRSRTTGGAAKEASQSTPAHAPAAVAVEEDATTPTAAPARATSPPVPDTIRVKPSREASAFDDAGSTRTSAISTMRLPSAATSAFTRTAPADEDPSISRLLGTQADTFHGIKPSDREGEGSARMSVREVAEGIREGVAELGKQRCTSGKRVAVLISGTGSNLQALIDATHIDAVGASLPNAHISLVVSNRKAAYGLQRASSSNPPIPTLVCALKTYQNKHPGATREDYDEELARRIVEAHEGRAPDLIVLAGFMHIVSPTFLRAMGHNTSLPAEGAPAWTPARAVPIINLHPALPGAFDGAHAIERAHAAIEAGEVDRTGVMVHEVIAEVDRGAPVLVREIIGRKGEPVEELEQRIHAVEHELIVEGARVMLQRADAPRITQNPRSPVDLPNPWASGSMRGDKKEMQRIVTEPADLVQSPREELPPRPDAPTPSAVAPTAFPLSPTSPATAASDAPVDSAAQFTSVRSAIASWGTTTSSGTPPLSQSSAGAVPRARRRTLSRPSSVYGGGPALPDLVETPEAAAASSSVAEAAARWGSSSASSKEAPVAGTRSRKTSATASARPQTMYAAVPAQQQSVERPTTLKSASALKLEAQAAQLEALVSGQPTGSPISPAVPNVRHDLVRLNLAPEARRAMDVGACAQAESRVIASAATQMQTQAKSAAKTISLEVLSIAPSGATTPIAEVEQHILYESETLAFIQRVKASDGLVATHLYVRTGRLAKPSQGATAAKIQELAKRFATAPVLVPQGAETREVAQLCGVGTGKLVVSRQGSRARWEEEGTILYEIRSSSGLVTAEQVDLDTANLCSAHSYLASVLSSPFIWHGLGTSVSERSTACLLLPELFPEGEEEPTEHVEGQEDDGLFSAFFDATTPYANAWHHRQRALLSEAEREVRLYNVDASSRAPLRVAEGRPPCVSDLDGTAVQLLLAPLEAYVIVGASARSKRADIRAAIDLAEALTHQAQLRRGDAVQAHVPTHVVVRPSILPRELAALLRGARAAEEKQTAQWMNVLTAAQARRELACEAFAKSELRDVEWLPCGVAPEDV